MTSARVESQPPAELDGLEVVGYTDVGGRPAFKLALQVTGDRWFLFAGHLWHRGWTVIEVTDPGAAGSASPTVAGALAHLDCELLDTVGVADHTIVFGRVRAARAAPRGTPLLYHRRGYRRAN